MARKRKGARRAPRSNPRGVLDVRRGGYGFVKTAEGEFFVPQKKMAGAFDGDLVEVAPLPASHTSGRGGADKQNADQGGKPAARVVGVIDRAHDTVIGRYEVAEPFGVVVPEDPRLRHDIFTMRADAPDIPDDSIVRVRITEFPTRHTAATGVVEEVIGQADDGDVAIDLIVARHKLETRFSEGSLAEARVAVLDAEGALANGYRDLQDRLVFTIDPTDARDFDDALSLEWVSTCESEGGSGSVQSLRHPDSHEGPTGAFGSCGTRFVDTPRASLSSGTETHHDGRVVDVGDGSVVYGEYSAKEGETTCEGAGGRGLWRVGVHIADVSHYVPWDSSIDLDARRRATSTYLADRVIPMLPEELSNDLCSLKPGEVRRTMTADLYLDEGANLVRCEFYPALIRSAARLTYDEVQEVLDGETEPAEGTASRQGPVAQTSWARTNRPLDGSARAELALWAPPRGGSLGGGTSLGEHEALRQRLAQLSRIAKARAAARARRGGLDFATAEAKVRLDGEGHPTGIDLRRKTDATELVEEAMILANEAVAAHLDGRFFPSLYRVHEQPSPDSLAGLVPVLQEFPWFKRIDKDLLVAGDAHAVQDVLAESAGRPEGELVSTLVLRSMKRAVYKPACEGHYGLASAAYTHFTSPIRRYPDLVVHRMLKAQLLGAPAGFARQTEALGWIAEHSSDMERVADTAARESQEYKIIEYLQRDIGTAFSAVVSGVASYGLYVRLENTAEGLVPVRSLGSEYFALDPVRYTLTGQDTGTVYRLGQRMAVVLVAAEPRTRTLDFRLKKD